jgi:hypothetical protein
MRTSESRRLALATQDPQRRYLSRRIAALGGEP